VLGLWRHTNPDIPSRCDIRTQDVLVNLDKNAIAHTDSDHSDGNLEKSMDEQGYGQGQFTEMRTQATNCGSHNSISMSLEKLSTRCQGLVLMTLLLCGWSEALQR
jgi:hypothetical protein